MFPPISYPGFIHLLPSVCPIPIFVYLSVVFFKPLTKTILNNYSANSCSAQLVHYPCSSLSRTILLPTLSGVFVCILAKHLTAAPLFRSFTSVVWPSWYLSIVFPYGLLCCLSVRASLRCFCRTAVKLAFTHLFCPSVSLLS